MSRHIMILAVSFLITNCAWQKDKQEDEDFSPNCSFTLSANPPAVTISPYPEQLDIPHDQKRLQELMSTAEGPCYVKHQGRVHVFKIPVADSSPLPLIAALPAAPGPLQSDWSRQETALGRPLLGLTTFNFHAPPDEQIVNATITLRETVSLWPLWHEFSHYMIGQKRVDDPHKTIAIPDGATLQKGKQDFIASLQNHWSQPTEENLNRVMTAFRRALIDQKNHIEKRFLDEIVIETTLIQTVFQAPQSFSVGREDIGESMGTVQFFSFQYRSAVQDIERDLINPLQAVAQTPAQQKLASEAATELRDKVRTLDKLLTEVSNQANWLMQQLPSSPSHGPPPQSNNKF